MYIRKVSYWARLEKTGESTGNITERWGKMGKAREGWRRLENAKKNTVEKAGKHLKGLR